VMALLIGGLLDDLDDRREGQRNPVRCNTIFCRPFSTPNPADRVFFQHGDTR